MIRSLFHITASLAFLFCTSFVQAASAGDVAPNFTLSSDNGPLSLSAYKGKTVYLDFWASWCGPCRDSFPWMNRLKKEFSSKNFAVIAVNLDQNAADAKSFLAEVPAQFTVLYDARGATATSYDVSVMPSSYLIAPNGKILFAHKGFTKDKGEELLAQIRRAVQ